MYTFTVNSCCFTLNLETILCTVKLSHYLSSVVLLEGSQFWSNKDIRECKVKSHSSEFSVWERRIRFNMQNSPAVRTVEKPHKLKRFWIKPNSPFSSGEFVKFQIQKCALIMFKVLRAGLFKIDLLIEAAFLWCRICSYIR